MITRRKFTALLAVLAAMCKPLIASILQKRVEAYIPPTKMKVVRDEIEIGVVDLVTGDLASTDGELNQLWQKWLEDGFKVLGPAPEEPPAGVLTDALYTVHPSPKNMGLVAIELGMHGYNLEFC